MQIRRRGRLARRVARLDQDLTDVASIRTTYGSPLFADHVPTRSHPRKIESQEGLALGYPSNEGGGMTGLAQHAT